MKGKFSKENNPFYGKKHSLESRQKISHAAQNRTIPHHRKQIEIDNVQYQSIIDAARKLNKNRTTIHNWLKNGKAKIHMSFIKFHIRHHDMLVHPFDLYLYIFFFLAQS